MRYCARCLYPANHPLNIVIGDDGICSGCRVHEEKDVLDWTERRQKLASILDQYRSRTGRTFDCIVPVTGGRDSHFIVDTIKREFGMNPLLVSYNQHYNTALGIRNLSYLRTQTDCDFVQFMVGVDNVKRITRATVRLMGSIYWHILAGLTVFPVQTAVRFKIPLIIWGFHQGMEQVGMFSHLDEVEMTRKYRKDHDLMGWEAEDLLADPTLSEGDVEPWIYPHNRELEKVGVRGIYLDNYIRWDSKAQHEAMIRAYGYETLDQARTFDRYMNVDCYHYSGLHDHIKYLKWGYGRAADHASREVRLRRMTRRQGIAQATKYAEAPARDARVFLEWIGWKAGALFEEIDRFRDPRIWRRDGTRWTLLDSVANHADDPNAEAAALPLRESNGADFVLTPPRQPNSIEYRHRILARGWADRWY